MASRRPRPISLVATRAEKWAATPDLIVTVIVGFVSGTT